MSLRESSRRAAAAMALAVLRSLGPERAWRLLHLVRERDPRLVSDLIEYILQAELPDHPMRRSFLLYYVKDFLAIPGAILPFALPEADAAAKLDRIPSETTPLERRFLHAFFSGVWDGAGSVVEVGPFLGGTTAAIAWGMLDNPRRNDGARLYTYDRFCRYHEPASLRSICRPLVERGVLSGAVVDRISADGSFRDIFQALHEGQPYGRLVVPQDMPLPELSAQVAAGGWFHAPDGVPVSVFFVDGCKAWFATKYFMREACRVAAPGAYFIFQDYLQYTCFWLPAFVESLDDAFVLVGYVDQTYTFQLRRRLSPEEIDGAYPDQPEELGRDRLDPLFVRARAKAVARNDRQAQLKHGVQYAAALAYIGESDRARAMLDTLVEAPEAAGYEALVREARRSPTYRPNSAGGEQVYL